MRELLRIQRPAVLRGGKAEVKEGKELYAQTCRTCHGDEAEGGVKDLRWMSPETHKQFVKSCWAASAPARAWRAFKDLPSEGQANAIHTYMIAHVNEDWGGAGAQRESSANRTEALKPAGPPPWKAWDAVTCPPTPRIPVSSAGMILLVAIMAFFTFLPV